MQAQQLAVDLEAAREQLAVKNRDVLKLQERLLDAEVQQRDNDTKLRCSQEALRLEVGMQEGLNNRLAVFINVRACMHTCECVCWCMCEVFDYLSVSVYACTFECHKQTFVLILTIVTHY